jgi:DUF1680 family protein
VGTEDFYTTKHSETCSITDMLHVAIKLAEAGHPEYWTHAERFVRNHLIESQWTREDWLPEPKTDLPGDDEVSTRRDMAEKIMGGYAGRTLPNEFVKDGVMMGCCCGAGPRALALAWQNTLVRKSDGLYVNLFLNRFSPQADVLSYLPHRGRIEIRMWSSGPLKIRQPDAQEAHVSIDGAPVDPGASAGYLCFDRIGEGQSVMVEFPLSVEDREERLLDWDLRLRWRGDTIVSMSPAGHRLRLYERSSLDTDEVPVLRDGVGERRDPGIRL